MLDIVETKRLDTIMTAIRSNERTQNIFNKYDDGPFHNYLVDKMKRVYGNVGVQDVLRSFTSYQVDDWEKKCKIRHTISTYNEGIKNKYNEAMWPGRQPRGLPELGYTWKNGRASDTFMECEKKLKEGHRKKRNARSKKRNALLHANYVENERFVKNMPVKLIWNDLNALRYKKRTSALSLRDNTYLALKLVSNYMKDEFFDERYPVRYAINCELMKRYGLIKTLKKELSATPQLGDLLGVFKVSFYVWTGVDILSHGIRMMEFVEKMFGNDNDGRSFSREFATLVAKVWIYLKIPPDYNRAFEALRSAGVPGLHTCNKTTWTGRKRSCFRDEDWWWRGVRSRSRKREQRRLQVQDASRAESS